MRQQWPVAIIFVHTEETGGAQQQQHPVCVCVCVCVGPVFGEWKNRQTTQWPKFCPTMKIRSVQHNTTQKKKQLFVANPEILIECQGPVCRRRFIVVVVVWGGGWAQPPQIGRFLLAALGCTSRANDNITRGEPMEFTSNTPPPPVWLNDLDGGEKKQFEWNVFKGTACRGLNGTIFCVDNVAMWIFLVVLLCRVGFYLKKKMCRLLCKWRGEEVRLWNISGNTGFVFDEHESEWNWRKCHQVPPGGLGFQSSPPGGTCVPTLVSPIKLQSRDHSICGHLHISGEGSNEDLMMCGGGVC